MKHNCCFSKLVKLFFEQICNKNDNNNTTSCESSEEHIDEHIDEHIYEHIYEHKDKHIQEDYDEFLQSNVHYVPIKYPPLRTHKKVKHTNIPSHTQKNEFILWCVQFKLGSVLQRPCVFTNEEHINTFRTIQNMSMNKATELHLKLHKELTR
jgi:hypothetical protein